MIEMQQLNYCGINPLAIQVDDDLAELAEECSTESELGCKPKR